MDLKKPLTFDEQLDKLETHGMIIADREKAKDILKRVSYYRFTGYALQFKQELSGSNYIEKLHLKRYIIYIKWMKYYVIHFGSILKK